VAALAGAAVVATHIRLAPRVPDPEPHYDDLIGEVEAFLVERATRARDAGIADSRIVIDAGLGLGKSPEQSLKLLRASGKLASLGWTLLLSASNKPFLGALFGLDVHERSSATLAAHALGVSLGCRIVRAHDVRAARRVCDTIAAILEAQ
jgi:dihydropteroate synthase